MRAATIAHDGMAAALFPLLTREARIERNTASPDAGPEPTPSWSTRIDRIACSEPEPMADEEETRTGMLTRHKDAYGVVLDGWRSTVEHTDRLAFYSDLTELFDIVTVERVPHCPLTKLVVERVTT